MVKKSDIFVCDGLLCAARDARGLALDAVEAANSGHLGMPMGCAEIGAALFGKLLNFDAENPTWLNRDRFVLSAGHGSMFLYTWLHLSGYGISLGDIKNFRKTGSVTKGHPEFDANLGIECTTGPLGQGVANAVGIAVSCKKRAAMFNTDGFELFNGSVVCLCGDGCLQEGISAEACALAGHWQLDNLIIIFDSNGVTLDADLRIAQSEDIGRRFGAYGFEVFSADGNDPANFMETFSAARESTSHRPKLIIANTVIGLGVDEVAGTNKAHGTAGVKFLGEAKRRLGLPDEKFFVSEETKAFFAARRAECREKYYSWIEVFNDWQMANRDLSRKLSEHGNFRISAVCRDVVPSDKGKMSTRVASGEIFRKIAHGHEFAITGSADLFSSTCNYIGGGGDFSAKNPSGRNLYFGVREHAMAAISNGISYDGMFRPSCSTFLVFSDYMRAAIRVAALAKLNTIFIFTHDSIAVGEDGPTHQPVETIASLRSIPRLDVVRPADYEETVGAWNLAMGNVNRPTAMILSRQDLPLLDGVEVGRKRNGALVGAYIARDETDPLWCIVIASGSELHLALELAKSFAGMRVVSMPCMEVFERQTAEYKDGVLPKSCTKRIAIEAGIPMPWYKYADVVVGVDDFGFSGQATDLMESYGITLKNLAKSVEALP